MFLLSRTILDLLDTSVILPTDKILEMLQLAHSLFQMQPVTVHQVMSSLGKTSRHVQLWHFFCII